MLIRISTGYKYQTNRQLFTDRHLYKKFVGSLLLNYLPNRMNKILQTNLTVVGKKLRKLP